MWVDYRSQKCGKLWFGGLSESLLCMYEFMDRNEGRKSRVADQRDFPVAPHVCELHRTRCRIESPRNRHDIISDHGTGMAQHTIHFFGKSQLC